MQQLHALPNYLPRMCCQRAMKRYSLVLQEKMFCSLEMITFFVELHPPWTEKCSVWSYLAYSGHFGAPKHDQSISLDQISQPSRIKFPVGEKFSFLFHFQFRCFIQLSCHEKSDSQDTGTSELLIFRSKVGYIFALWYPQYPHNVCS